MSTGSACRQRDRISMADGTQTRSRRAVYRGLFFVFVALLLLCAPLCVALADEGDAAASGSDPVASGGDPMTSGSDPAAAEGDPATEPIVLDTEHSDGGTTETVETVVSGGETAEEEGKGDDADTSADGGIVTIAGMIVTNGSVIDNKHVEAVPDMTEAERVFKSDGTNNPIQLALDAAIKKSVSDATKAAIIITVSKGTYADAVNIKAGAGNLASNIVLVSEEAFSVDDNGDAAYASVGGDTKLSGNITVESLDVLLYGLYLATDKIVKAKNASVEIVGTTESDTINVEIASGENERFGLSVKGEDGNDTVKITQTGADYGTNSVPMPITVEGGAGNDSVTLSLGGRQTVEATVDGGAGNDTIDLTIASELDTATKKVTVTDSEGDNTVTAALKKNSAELTVTTGGGNDTVTVSSDGDASKCKLAVSTGAGNDTIGLNASLGSALDHPSDLAAVTVDAGEGQDTLRLSGALKSSDANDQLGGDTNALWLVNSKGVKLSITLNQTVEHFIDDLSGKPKIDITKVDAEGYALNGNGQRITPTSFFTYYVTKMLLTSGDLPFFTESGTAEDADLLYTQGALSLRMLTPTQKLLLSILNINLDGGVTIGTVLTPGMALQIYAPEITVTGNVEADSIYLSAYKSDSMFTRKVDGKTVPVEGSDSFPEKLKDSLISGFTFKGTAAVTIASTARLHTSDSLGKVELLSEVSYTRMLLSLANILSGFNFANVKICTSKVDIQGSIEANIVRAAAKATATLQASNSEIALLYVPVAVSVGLVECGVTVSGAPSASRPTIKAGEEVTLSADSAVTVETIADTGRLPISVGVSVVDSTVYAKAEKDALIECGGNVTIKATGTTKVKTVAEKGAKDGGFSGGYVAVSVVTQDVVAGVYGNASVVAGKDISIDAIAKETILNKATSSTAPDPDFNPDGDINFSADFLIGYASKLISTLGKLGISEGLDKLTKAKKQIDGSAYAVTPSGTEHGSLSVSAAKADKGDTVTITVSPDKDYKLDGTPAVTYTPKGTSETASVTVTKNANVGNVFTFQMPEGAVRVSAKFVSSPGSGGGSGSGGSGKGNSIKDVVNAAASSSSDANRAVKSEASSNTAAKKIAVESTDAHGAAMLDVAKLAGQADILVLPSKNVRVNVNPAANYTLDTLKACYTLNGTVHETVITQNVNGEYVLTMPNAAVTLKATFKEGKPAEQSASTLQLTGSIAVSVGGNGSTALVDTNGRVTAAGKLRVNGTAETNVENTADATANGSAPVPPTEEKDVEVMAGREISEHLQVAELRNGYAVSWNESEINDSNKEKNGTEYKFTFTPRLGYTVSAVKLTYKNTAGEDASCELQKIGTEGAYYLFKYGQAYDPGTGAWSTPKYGLSYTGKYTVTATFSKVGDGTTVRVEADAAKETGSAKVQVAEKNGGVVTYRDGTKARQGDTLVFSLLPGTGNAIDAASDPRVTYTENGIAKTLTVGNGLTKSNDGKVYGFVMPNAVATIHVGFVKKVNTVQLTLVDANGSSISAYSEYLTVSDDKAVSPGETFTVTLKEKALLEGMRLSITELKETNDQDTKWLDSKAIWNHREGFSVTVEPLDGGKFTLYVALKLVKANCDVTFKQDAAGNTVTLPKAADAGDTIRLTPKAANDYKYKEGTLLITVAMSSKTMIFSATRGKAGVYTCTIPVPDAGVTIKSVTVSAEFEKSPGSKHANDVSVGVGVAVAVVNSKNTVSVKSGTIAANDLSVTANSISNAASTAKAGFSKGDFGLAGSIGVNVAAAETSALLTAQPIVSLGDGGLTVKAFSTEKFTVNADSAGQKMQQGTGVGAAIAVGVFTADVKAAVEEGAQIIRTKDTLGDVSIGADNTLTEALQSKAGASGGTAVCPVISVVVSETSALAYIGKGLTETDPSAPALTANAIAISASNTAKRTVQANASAAGSGVGVGASFVVTYLKDRARARLSRNAAAAKQLSVKASGISSMKGTSKAGANGAAPKSKDGGTDDDGGEADKQAGKALSSAKGLKGQSDNASESKKQKAETSEGSVSVAAAFLLNIHSHTVESAIDGGAIVNAPDADVSVESEAKLTLELSANGAATVAKIGVGVAVALNVLSYTNIAYIGEARVTAKNLTVSATIPKDRTEDGSITEKAGENYLVTLLRELLTGFFNKLASDSTLAPFLRKVDKSAVIDFLLKALLGENNCNLKALLSGTGLEPLVEQNPAEVFMKNFDAVFGKFKEAIKHDDYDKVKKIIKDEVVKEVVPVALKALLAAIGVIKDSSGFKSAVKGLAYAIADKVRTMYADISYPAGFADTLSDLLISATSSLMKDIVDLAALKKFITDNFKDKVVTNLKSYLSHLGMALTNAAIDKLSSYGNVKLAPTVLAPAHTFYTYAIAGAGATDVGVAGSVAVNWITGTTLAYIAPVEAGNAQAFAIVASGDTLVRAESVHRMETIASSAVGSAGKPDKNQTGDGDAKKSTDAAYATESVSLSAGGAAHTMYLTTGNAAVTNKADTADTYTIKYAAKDGYKFTDKSVVLTDIDKANVTQKINSDGSLEITVTKASELKASFTVKVTAVVCDEREIKTDNKITVTGPCDVSIELSKQKARKTDRITLRFTPKTKTEGSKTIDFTVVETNLKKAFEAGLVRVVDPENEANTLSVDLKYEVDKKGSIVFSFLMPDQNVKLNINFAKQQGNEFIFKAEDPKEIPTTEAGKGIGIGAAFAFAYTTFDTNAYIGENRAVTSGTLWLDADGGLEAETIAVSGTDPIATHKKYYQTQDIPDDTVKKTAIDCGVAFAYLGGNVKAWVDKGAVITTTGGDARNINKLLLGKDATSEHQELSQHKVNFAVTSAERSETEARASAFTAGSATAVGACVAVSYIDVASGAAFRGTAVCTGTVELSAKSSSKDAARGMATAMGADMERYCKKFTDGAGTFEEKANKVTNGKAFDEMGNKKGTDTGTRINTKFNESQGQGGKSTNANAPISSQALRSQNAKGDATEAINKGNDAASKAGVGNKNGGAQASYQIAAAVSVNITKHAANTLLEGNIVCGALHASAVNNGNFSTLATGAAMSLAKNSNAIAAAVSVSVNRNEAIVRVGDGVSVTKNQAANVAGDGAIRFSSATTQNLTEEFSRYMTAQSIAGAVSGADGKFTVAGAVSIVVANAKTETIVGKNTVLRGDAISVSATDKSRLAVRAGALSVSRGAAMGVGASFALIYAEDALLASIGDDCSIRGTSFALTAEKLAVTYEDYDALDWRFLFTNSSDLTDEERARAKTGIIDVHKTKDDKGALTGGYTVDVNFSSDTALELLELMNGVSAVNYYIEAVSGTVTTGSNTQMALSGSFAILLLKNRVEALVGDGVSIDVTAKASVNAGDQSRVRVIGGAVAAGPAKNGGGLTVAFLKDNGTVTARVGNAAGTTRVNAGNFALTATTAADYLVITVAAAVISGSNAAGGAVTVSVLEHSTVAEVAGGVRITSAEIPSLLPGAVADLAVSATTDLRMMLISASVMASKSVAAGGTIAAAFNNMTNRAVVGSDAVLSAEGGSVSILAQLSENLFNVLASASAALSTGGSASVAGAVGLLWDTAKTRAEIGARVTMLAEKNIAVRASVDTQLLNIFVGAAYTPGAAAIGMTVMVNHMEREAIASVGSDGVLTARTGNITVDALGREWTLIVEVGAGVAKNVAVAGANGVVLSQSTIAVRIGDRCRLTAGDSISLTSDLDSKDYQFCCGAGFSGTVGVGETVTVMTIQNTVETTLGLLCTLTANGAGDGVVTANRNERRRGVYIGATTRERLVIASVSGAASGSVAVSGVAHVLYEKNKVRAVVGEGTTLSASGADIVGAIGETISSDVVVEADDDSSIIDAAGGLSAAGSAGFGATAIVLLFGKTVSADAQRTGGINAAGHVEVQASSTDTLALLALGFGAAGSLALAATANLLMYEDKVSARLGGTVNAGKDIAVSADVNDVTANIVVSVAVGGGVGVSGAAILTFYEGVTETNVSSGSVLTAGGSIRITARSREYITSDGVGVAGGSTGVGGMLDLIHTKVVTKAVTGSDVTLSAALDVTVSAADDYLLLAVAGMIGAGAGVGLGVVAVVSLHYNTVAAHIGETNRASGRNVYVLANEKRDFQVFSAALAGAGAAAVAASVAVLVAGSNVTQDVCETIMGTETVGGTTYTVLADQRNKDRKLYRNGSNYYTKSGNVMQQVSVQRNENGSVSYGGVTYYPATMDPQAQVDGVLSRCKVNVRTDSDARSVNDALAGDGNTSSDMGGNVYGEYANQTTADNANNGKEEIVSSETTDRTDVYLDPARSTVTKKDGTSALVGGGTSVTATGNIEIVARDLLLVLALSGSVAAGGAAGVGVGVAAAKLMSKVEATAAEGSVLSAEGDIILRAVTGAENKTISDTFCPVTNTMGNQQKANENMVSLRAKLVDCHVMESSDQAASLWLIGVAAAGGGAAGVSVAGGVLIFYSSAVAMLKGSVTKADTLVVDAQNNYKHILTAVLAAGAGGVAGVGASVALTYLAGTVLAEIGENARVSGVTTGVTVSASGESVVHVAAAAVGIGGVAGIAVNVAVVMNRNDVTARIASRQEINVPLAAVNVHAKFTSDMRALLLTAAVGGVAAVGASVLLCISKLKTRAYIGVDPSGVSTEDCPGVLTAGSISVKSEAVSPVRSLIFSAAASLVAINGVVTLSFNRVVNVAALNGKPFVCTGDVDVTAKLSGETKADTYTGSVGLVTIAVVVSLAVYTSDNRAFVRTARGASSAAKLTILADAGVSDASSHIGVGATIALVSISVYVSLAWNDGVQRALLHVAGALDLSDDLSVISSGTATASAQAQTLIDVSLLKIASIVSSARSRSDQSAAITLDGGTLTARGIVVQSVYEATGNGTHAVTGNADRIPDVNVVGLSFLCSDAASRVTNHAYVAGYGSISADRMTVEALTTSIAKANTMKSSVSLVKESVIIGKALVQDDTQAYVDAGRSALPLTVKLKGELNVHTKAQASVHAESITPLTVNLVNLASGSVAVFVGSGSGSRHTAKAFIGRTVLAEASAADILAESVTSAKARMNGGITVSGVNVTSSLVPTHQYIDLFAGVGEGSALSTTKDDLVVHAKNAVAADSLVDGTSVGVLVSADRKYAENTLDESIALTVGSNASLSAYKELALLAETNATLIAKTDASSGGLFSSGKLLAKNDIVRTVRLSVGDGAKLFADYGDLRLTAKAGEEDDIATYAQGSGGGLVGIGELESNTAIRTDVRVAIGAGVMMTNTFNDIVILASASESKAVSTGDYSISGLVAAPEVRSFLTSISLTANVDFSGADAPAKLTARNVFVKAETPSLRAEALSGAQSYMLGGTTRAYSSVTLTLSAIVALRGTQIKAYDAAQLVASVNPESYSTAVNVRANAFSGAVISNTLASAKLLGTANAKVSVESAARLTGALVEITAKQFVGTVNLSASARKAALGWRSEEEKDELSTSSANVAQRLVAKDVVFHVADGAAGIVLEYSEQGGSIAERSVGMPGVGSNSGSYAVITASEISLTGVKIQNVLPGKLVAEGVDLSANAIYGQRYMEAVTIINRTAAKLILGEIDTSNEAFTRSSVTAGAFNTTHMHESPVTHPTVSVYSYAGGALEFHGRMTNEMGKLHIEWVGAPGDLTTYDKVFLESVQIAPIWAHSLEIVNAKKVGVSQTKPFEAYLAGDTQEIDGRRVCVENAALRVSAQEAYLMTYFADIIAFDGGDLPDGIDTSPISGALDIGEMEIVSELYLTCGTPFRMMYADRAEAAVIVLPGVVEFTTETEHIGGSLLDNLFSMDSIARYYKGTARVDRTGGDPIELKTYSMPNGMTVYLVSGQTGKPYGFEENEVYKVVGGNVKFDASQYLLVLNSDNELTLTFTDTGDVLNLESGEFTAADVGSVVYIAYDMESKRWILRDGDTIVDEPMKDLFKVKFKTDENGRYVYDAYGQRIVDQDASGNLIIDVTNSFGKPLFKRTVKGTDGYFYLLYTEGAEQNVDYLVLNKDGMFLEVYYAPGKDGWVSTRDVRSHGYDPGQAYHTIENFFGVSGLKLEAHFTRTCGSGDRLSFKWHKLYYNGTEITDAITTMSLGGTAYYTIDYRDIAVETYWFYSYYGGKFKNEETFVNMRWLYSESLTAEELPNGAGVNEADGPYTPAYPGVTTISYNADNAGTDENGTPFSPSSVSVTGDFMDVAGLEISWTWVQNGDRYGYTDLVLSYEGAPIDPSRIAANVVDGQTWYSIDGLAAANGCSWRMESPNISLDPSTADDLHLYYKTPETVAAKATIFGTGDPTGSSPEGTIALYIAAPIVVKEQYTDGSGRKYELTYSAYRHGVLTDGDRVKQAIYRRRYCNLLQYNEKYFSPKEEPALKYRVTFTTDVVYGKMGTNMRYVVPGAFVYLDAGQKIHLYFDTADSTYRVFEDLWVSKTGVVTRVTDVGMVNDKQNYDVLVYDAPGGLFSVYRQIGSDKTDRTLTFSLRKNAGTLSMTINGDIHFERLSDEVACDILGRYFVKTASGWELLSRVAEPVGVQYPEKGYTVDANGYVTVYWNHMKLFSTAKNAAGKWVHTVYDMVHGTERYSVDADGNVSWGTVYVVAVAKANAGSDSNGGYVLSGGADLTGTITVAAGTALRTGRSGTDCSLENVVLLPANKEGPITAPDLPGGKFIASRVDHLKLTNVTVGAGGELHAEANSAEIGTIRSEKGTVDLHAVNGPVTLGSVTLTDNVSFGARAEDGNVSVDSLSGSGGKVELTTKAGDIALGTAALTGINGFTVSTERGGVRTDSLSLTDSQGDALVRANGGNASLGAVTMQSSGALTVKAHGGNAVIGATSLKNSGLFTVQTEGGSASLGAVTLENSKGLAVSTGYLYGAAGSILLDSLTGNGGDVSLATASGDIDIPNDMLLTGAGSVRMTAERGDITLDGRTEITANGGVTLSAASGDLYLEEAILENGPIALHAGKDLTAGTMELTSSGTTPVRLTAGGDLAINDVTFDSDAPDAVQLSAAGALTLDQSDTEDCAGLTLDGGNISMEQNIGLLRLRQVKAKNTLSIGTSDAIVDVSDNAVKLPFKEYYEAQLAADDALFPLFDAKRVATAALREKQAADMALMVAQDAYDKADPKDPVAMRKAEEALRAAQQLARDAMLALIDAEDVQEEKQNAYNALRTIADAAWRKLAPLVGQTNGTVDVGGSATIEARGDIGSVFQPLLFNVDGRSTLTAPNVYLQSERNVHIDEITTQGGNVEIAAIGNIDQSASFTGTTSVHGADIRLTSLRGNVGSRYAPMTLDIAGDVDVGGNDIFVQFIQQGTTTLDGALLARGTETDWDALPSGSMWLWADNDFERDYKGKMAYGRLYLNAKRTPDPPEPSPRKGGGNALYGKTAFAWRTLVDIPTGVTVSGYLSRNAALYVDRLAADATDLDALLTDDCDACGALHAARETLGILSAYAIRVTGERDGLLYVTIPVEGVADGETVYLLCCVEGRLVIYRLTVKNGTVQLAVDGMTMHCVLLSDTAEVAAYVERLIAERSAKLFAAAV